MASDGARPAVGVLLPPGLARAEVLPFIRRAEEAGFAELWVVEDLGFRGGVSQAAVALAATSTITVGVGVLPAAARNVAFAAMEIATLAELFGERLVVGVGHGMPGWLTQVGCWPASPLTLLSEYLTALRALLNGDRVTTHGRYVTLEDFALRQPPAVVPPLVAGVRGPKSLALAGALADGTLLAEPSTPEYIRAALDQLGAAAGHRLVTYNVAAVADTADAARAQARTGLAQVGEPDWAPHIRPLPFAAEFAALRNRCANGAEFAAVMPDAWVDQLAVVGTPAAARARIVELGAAGATTAVLIPAGPDPLAALAALAALA